MCSVHDYASVTHLDGIMERRKFWSDSWAFCQSLQRVKQETSKFVHRLIMPGTSVRVTNVRSPREVKGKGKGFPYSIPSVGPGADHGVQAVNPQVTVNHPPGGRLSLLSARPASPNALPVAPPRHPLERGHQWCFLISFPRDTISFPRNAMSRERDSYFVGTNYYFEGTK